jgi:hypothetical protein
MRGQLITVLISVLLLMGLSACTTVGVSASTPTVASTITPAVTNTPTVTPTPTATPFPALPSCNGESYSYNGDLNGIMAVDGVYESKEQFIFIDLADGTRTAVPAALYWTIVTDYKNNHFVYARPGVIDIFSDKLKILQRIELPDSSKYLPYYTNWKYIVLSGEYDVKNGGSATVQPVTLVNLDNGQLVTMSQNYPGITPSIQARNYSNDISSFNSKLDQVFIEDGKGSWTLFDVKTKEVIINGGGIIPKHTHFPIWSKDDSYAILYSNSAKVLSKVYADGRVLDFAPLLEHYFPQKYTITEMEVAPDAKQVELLVGMPNARDVPYGLFHLDLESWTITPNCSGYISIGMVWSPGSRYVAFQMMPSKTDFRNVPIVVLDIKTNKMYTLENHFAPVGWIN